MSYKIISHFFCGSKPPWYESIYFDMSRSTKTSEDTPNMSGENHSFQLSAASIWAKLFADMLWNCMLRPPLPLSAHACSCWVSSLYNPHTTATTAYTHATGTRQSWRVLSANLKRKMRSWWGAEDPVQRRPVEGCRAEKILRSTNTNMEKKKGRKREKRQKKQNMNHG